MSISAAFYKIKEGLISLDYPGLNSTPTEDDILNIVDPKNRITFLKWIFMILDSEVFINLSEEEIVKELLPDFLECYGFCKKEEITPFIDGTLNFQSQVDIVQRSIHFTVLCVRGRARTSPPPHKDLNSILKQIDEAFPNLQEVKNTTNDKKLDEESLQKENEALLKELEELEKTKPIDLPLEEIKNLDPDELGKNLDEFKKNLHELKDNLELFQIKCAAILDEPKKEVVENQSVKVPPGLKEEIKKFVELQEDVKVIASFKENLSSIEVRNNPIKKEVEDLVVLSRELLDK
ncbi:myosin heavy chain, clone 203-like [Onthophagus taurus]|uniref:myosin heavy chain, clone 203-like n=1 Tax=Onthophagus taurus TaxID=166361 RepID=UPI0039BECF43